MDVRITMNSPKTIGQMCAVFFKGRQIGDVGTMKSGQWIVVGCPCGTHETAEDAATALARYAGRIK